MRKRLIEILLRIGIVLLAAGVITLVTDLLVHSGALNGGGVSQLIELGSRQLDRTLVNPPAGSILPPDEFRGSVRDAAISAVLDGIVRNLLIIAAITMVVLAVRKILSAAIQVFRKKSYHPFSREP